MAAKASFTDVARNNLPELTRIHISMDLCNSLLAERLVTKNEYEELSQYVRTGSFTDASSMLYTSLINKFSPNQLAKFIRVLDESNLEKVIEILSKDPEVKQIAENLAKQKAGEAESSAGAGNKIENSLSNTTPISVSENFVEGPKNFIHYRDLAKFLAKSTTLPENWAEFFDVLSLPADVRHQAVMKIRQGSIYEAFCEVLSSWIGRLPKCDVKLLCEKLTDADQSGIAEVLLKDKTGVSEETLLSTIQERTGYTRLRI